MSAEVSVPNMALEEVVRLLKEQNEMLQRLLAESPPTRKAATDSDVAKVKAIAARIPRTEEAQFVVVDLETEEFATGRRIFEAVDRLGAPPERTLAMRTGGRTSRLRSPRPVR